MNGRIYDPLLGRFLSADILIQAPGSLQSYNRYSYVMNNPLTLVDHSGFDWDLSGLTAAQKKQFQDQLKKDLKNGSKDFKQAVQKIESNHDVRVAVSFAAKSAANAATGPNPGSSPSNVNKVGAQAASPTNTSGQMAATPTKQSSPDWTGFDVRSQGYMPPTKEGAAVSVDYNVNGNAKSKTTTLNGEEHKTLTFGGASISASLDKQRSFVMDKELDNAPLRRHEQVHQVLDDQAAAAGTDELHRTSVDISAMPGSQVRSSVLQSFVGPTAGLIVEMNVRAVEESATDINEQYDNETNHGMNTTVQQDWEKKTGVP